jgi:hypothetical protein
MIVADASLQFGLHSEKVNYSYNCNQKIIPEKETQVQFMDYNVQLLF